MFGLSNYLVKSCFWVYQPFGPSLVNICSFISQNSLLSPCPKCTIAETEMDGFCTYCFFFGVCMTQTTSTPVNQIVLACDLTPWLTITRTL